MKRVFAIAVLATFAGVSFAASHAGAAKPAKAEKELTPQQMLMKRCQEEATASGKKGKERQTMVNTCLSDGKKRQQEKMGVCNKEVEGKKGDERKKAMSECLKK